MFKECTIVERVFLTDDVVKLSCKLKEGLAFDFKPGQFVNIKVPDGQPGICFRAYSIAEYDDELHVFTLIIKLVPDGRASAFFRTCPIDTKINFMGPIGHFTMQDEARDQVWLATGTGIVPFLSYLKQLAPKKLTTRITLLWGVRFMKDVFYQSELDSFAQSLPNFSYSIALSKETDTHSHLPGRILDHLESIDVGKDAHYYLCGNGNMITQGENMLLEKLVSADDIFFEKFF